MVTAVTTLAVLQPGYLPWLGYFDQVTQADYFVHYDDVPFDKHGWRNRNRVKALNGPVWLTVPVLHSGKFGQLINEVRIDPQQNWQRKHLATIKQMYASAPYLNDWLPKLTEVIDRKWESLVDLNLAMTDMLLQAFRIETRMLRSSELGIAGDKNERLLKLCELVGATKYLTGDAARDYLDVGLFSDHGIEVRWHGYTHPIYPQLHGEFISHLSALDLLLNCGGESKVVLKSR
jgi:hypothetical protein